MSQLPAFRQLQNFIGEQTTRQPRKTKGSKPETANGLTTQIVKHIRKNGGFATRLSSTGVYRADIKKYVPNTQVAGLPDVFAVVDGRAVLIEVKIGRDKLSEVQQATIKALLHAGACVLVATSFQDFLDAFIEQFQPPSEA